VCERSRADIYLRPPGRDLLGIKLREGHLEVKRLIAQGENKELRTGVVGRIEEWGKWSFSLKDEASATAATFETDYWIKITKDRLLRKYEVVEDRTREVKADSLVAEGCNLELTAITVCEEEWWSVGFEAFGSTGRLESNLRLVVQAVLADARFPPMKADASLSYPEWLARFSP